MDHSSIKRSAVLMVLVVIAVLAATEMYLRSTGITPAYNEDAALWSNVRAKVYEPADKNVVFIGSSRIKYDLDIPTWQKLTGKRAVQLAMTGSNPRPVLEDLANDSNFKGNLVIDVTDPLFFSGAPMFDSKPMEYLHHYYDRTLAQRANFHINHALESQLVILDKDNYSINAALKALKVPNRPMVFEFPIFPVGFERTKFDEQAYMSPQFVADTNDHRQMINVWKYLSGGPKPPPMPDSVLMQLCGSVKTMTDKIKARGGKIFFVRTPSSGDMGFGESMGFPKERFWANLLKVTGCEGFHFTENPLTAQMICPENSHLKPTDAVIFTQELVKGLQGNPILQTSTTSTN